MASTPNRKKIKATLVALNITSHFLAAITRPGPPGTVDSVFVLGKFLKAQVAGPVLRRKTGNRRICVAIVHKNFELAVHGLVKGLEIGFRRNIFKITLGIVDLEKGRIYVKGILYNISQGHVFFQDGTCSTGIIVKSPVKCLQSQSLFPFQTIPIGAFVIQGVFEKSANLFLGHGYCSLAEIVIAAPACQKSLVVRVTASLHDLSKVVQGHLVVTRHEP
mmetsp:Transcript_2291/g.4842  ORF Transcript_2291/g.4842 Transcript_2291/m.4842 type:complete len:219 (-) Transcript_2291:54-710(-)